MRVIFAGAIPFNDFMPDGIDKGVEILNLHGGNRVAPKIEPMVDGYAGFLFLDKNDKPMVALHWEKYLEHIIEKYNKIYRIQMPKVTPHVCRHTFCSNMAKSGMNPKTLQYIMGHSDISVTLNVYTHVQFDDAQAELLRVAKA